LLNLAKIKEVPATILKDPVTILEYPTIVLEGSAKVLKNPCKDHQGSFCRIMWRMLKDFRVSSRRIL